jgi:hypothetical protein
MDNAPNLRANPQELTTGPQARDLHEANARPAVANALEEKEEADNGEADRAPKISPNRMQNSDPLASSGIRFSKMDWLKPNAQISQSSSWLWHLNATGFLASFDLATPLRRTVSSANQQSSKPPAILSAFVLTPTKAKRHKKLSAATSMAVLKTPPFASSLQTGKRSSQEAAVAPTKFSVVILPPPSMKSPMTIKPKASPEKRQFQIFQTSASGSMWPLPINESLS